MKITKHGIEVQIHANMIRPEEDYGVLSADGLAEIIRKIYGRQVNTLYFVEDDTCGPALLVRWLWNIDDDDDHAVLAITCSVEEEALLRRIGVL